MVVSIVINAQMDVHYIERNGVWRSNCNNNLYFSYGFSICRRPIFGVTLKTNKLKHNRVFASRMNNCGAISVLLKGESGTGLAEGGIIEEEFEFKPSFDEYLKDMESVRSVREKKGGHLSNQQRSRNDSRGKRGSSLTLGDDDNDELRDFEEPLIQVGSKLLDKDELHKNSSAATPRKGPISATINGKERGRRKLKDGRNIRFEDKGNAGNAHGLVRDELYFKQSKKDVKENGKLEMDTGKEKWINNQSSPVQGIQEKGNSSKVGKQCLINFESSGELERDVVHGRKVPDENVGAKKQPLSRRNMLIRKESSDTELEMERAAFKVLEEYDDVIDKPRVSRLDMEERIQKLAKCLNGADINMPEWMFSKIMRSAKIKFSDHSMLRVIQILGKLGNWRRVLQVIEWIQMRERFKSHKIRYIYTAALDALGKTKRPVEALNVFRAMQQHMSSYPDLVAYRCIAVTLGQAGHMKELFDVIDSMRSPPKKKFKMGLLEKWDPRLEPDIVVYNAVLNACVRRKKWEGAFWVLQQLKQQGQQPSSTTYGLIMEVMLACGKYNLVHDFFKRVQKACIPNALTYKVLVNTLWREGKTDEAVLAVQEMERRGIVGTAGLYYDIARCLCSAGRCREALMQIDKICKVANKPLVVTYTGLIQACLDSGDIQNGAYIFNHMHKFCSPNLVTCNIMMKSYLDHGMFEEAKELFQKSLENGNHMNSKSEYKNKFIPDIYSFNLMLDACVAEQKWDDLEFVYKQMLQHGHHFNAKRHLRIILDGCRAGKGELLETTWKHLIQENRVPPPLLIKEMFRTKLEQDECVGALYCFIGHPLDVSSQAFSGKSWLNFFKENAHRIPKDTLIKLLDEVSILVARSATPNLIFQNLATSCRDFLRTQDMFPEIDQIETVAELECEVPFIFR